jgi:hypothetical protein
LTTRWERWRAGWGYYCAGWRKPQGKRRNEVARRAFEISVDGKTRSYCETKAMAIEGASNFNRKLVYPRASVA